MRPTPPSQGYRPSSTATLPKVADSGPLSEGTTAIDNLPSSRWQETDLPPADPFEEERMRHYLSGSAVEIGQGLILLDRQLRPHLGAWLRRHFPWLSPEDRDDAWSETLLSVLDAARRRRFRPDRPLLPWLCHLVRARTVDFSRRQTAWQDFLANLARQQRRTAVDRPRQAGDGERTEMLELTHGFIAALPAQQKWVLQIFVEHYPASRSMTTLQREVSRASGQPPSLAGVKRALQEGRRKLRDYLRSKGYQPEGIDQP